MNNNEKIDILMATYNGEKYIEEQIESILNQTYKNIQLIVCDDFSKDNTLEILKKYEGKDSRIKVTQNDKNLGSNKNFEKLLAMVTSKYFMFSDQDDIWLKDKVQKTYDFLINNNKDFVYTDLMVYERKENKEEVLISKSFNRLKGLEYKLRKYEDYRLELLYNAVTGCTILCKSEYISKLVPFLCNKDFLHDAYIALIMSLNAKIGYLDEPTLKYMQHEKNQVGSSRYTDRFDTFDEVRNHFITIKLERFKFFLNNKKIFKNCYNEKEIINLCSQAINYYDMLINKKQINFKYLNAFVRLYEYEKFSYKFVQYIVLNVPIIARVIYNLRKRK